MCMNCGCMEPNDKHGNQANITLDEMREAAQANGQDLDEAMDNMERTYHQAVEDGDTTRSQHQHTF